MPALRTHQQLRLQIHKLPCSKVFAGCTPWSMVRLIHHCILCALLTLVLKKVNSFLRDGFFFGNQSLSTELNIAPNFNVWTAHGVVPTVHFPFRTFYRFSFSSAPSRSPAATSPANQLLATMAHPANLLPDCLHIHHLHHPLCNQLSVRLTSEQTIRVLLRTDPCSGHLRLMCPKDCG